MSGAAQLALDLAHRPALGREDFLAAPCNRAALGLIDRWPNWPGPAAIVHGPEGAGKTHLCQVWRTRSRALEITHDLLVETPPRDLVADTRACVIENAERLLTGGMAAEQALLHLHNILRELGGHLLLTARTGPASWDVDLPDLRSRLRAAEAIAITAPDDSTLEVLLVKLFADRQVMIRPDVPRYLAARIERTFGAARAVVDALDRAAMAERRDITVPFVRNVLETVWPRSSVD